VGVSLSETDSGADLGPNAEDHQGQGLLALACGMPRLEVVFQLLSWAKADVLPAPLGLDGHIREGKHAGSTPLIMALQIQDRDLVAALLEARANPNVVSDEGKHAVDYCNQFDSLQLLKKRMKELSTSQTLKSVKTDVIREKPTDHVKDSLSATM
jgi:ankyrin repeat protein